MAIFIVVVTRSLKVASCDLHCKIFVNKNLKPNEYIVDSKNKKKWKDMLIKT